MSFFSKLHFINSVKWFYYSLLFGDALAHFRVIFIYIWTYYESMLEIPCKQHGVVLCFYSESQECHNQW